MNPLRKLVRHRDFALVLIANMAIVLATFSSASHNSPLFDEPAHFASGAILAQFADAGYFRVNPPLNKWITAIAMLGVECDLPPLPRSSSNSNSGRPEFEAGEQVIELNRDRYIRILFAARLVRVPMLLFGSWMLWMSTRGWTTSRRLLCMALWCTSPLVLAHGSVVSADAPSGVAMCLVLWMTVRLWHNPSLVRFALSGVAWGLAIGTKFTFGPLYLVYPLLVHLSANKGWAHSMIENQSCSLSYKSVWLVAILARNWIVHAVVACIVLNSLYLFDEVGVPIGKHQFASHFFATLKKVPKNESSLFQVSKEPVLGWIPSPFPKAFLEGVDQQLTDMDSPRGAYLLGSRIKGKIHWFHSFGYLMKEQLAVWIAGLAIVVAMLLRWLRRTPRAETSVVDPLVTFAVLFLFSFALFMTTQCNLVWNMRYLILGCPLVYVIVAALLPPILSSTRTKPVLGVDVVVYGLIAVMTIEFASNFPYHFSYISPLFGGSHRVPTALNDSNFDYGQDLFRIRHWVSQRKPDVMPSDNEKAHVYGVLSGHGRFWLNDIVTPATDEVVQSVIERKERESAQDPSQKEEGASQSNVLIVSRGLTHPEPWAVRYSTVVDNKSLTIELVSQLLRYPPDAFITPTIAVYIVHR